MRRRAPNGAGTLYKEDVEGRAPRWVSEAHVNLTDGRRVRVRGRGRTPEEAIARRAEKAARLDDAFPVADRLTVRQLAERWVDARRPSWKPATVYSYRVALDRHVLPVIGDARVARVTALDVERILARTMRASDGRHVAAANRARRVAHALFAYAVDARVIRENPVDGVRSIRVDRAPVRAWSRAEALAFLVAADRSPYRDLFHAAVVTGLRQGELLALRWADVGAAGLRVERTFSRHAPGRIQATPKTATARRTVPAPPALLDRLEARRGPPGDLVFASRSGGVLNPSNVNRALRRYAIAAGVPVLRFHDLRRTYASLLAVEGYHPSVIQRHLGHASPELALRVYTSVSEAAAAGAVVDLTGGSSGGSRGSLERPEAAPEGRRRGIDVAPDTLN